MQNRPFHTMRLVLTFGNLRFCVYLYSAFVMNVDLIMWKVRLCQRTGRFRKFSSESVSFSMFGSIFEFSKNDSFENVDLMNEKSDVALSVVQFLFICRFFLIRILGIYMY